MNTPSKKECDDLFQNTGMFAHIVDHSRQVCRVATFLTDQLREADIFLNCTLIAAAALLHDITKTRSFDTGEDHTRTGEELLARLGYHEVGKIVGQHVALDTYFSSDVPDEAEIVNYADKRVLHDRIVSMDERMQYILEKYCQKPDNRRRCQRLWDVSREMEKRIFQHLSFLPEELEQQMETTLNQAQ